MYCWNALSEDQQKRLVEVGNLPLGYTPEGFCPNGAELDVETQYDEAPGPRFYCLPCGIEYLKDLQSCEWDRYGGTCQRHGAAWPCRENDGRD